MTSFPERWISEAEGPSLLSYMKQLVKRTNLSDGKQRLDTRKLLHDMLKHVLEFKPSLLITSEEQSEDESMSTSYNGMHYKPQSISQRPETHLGVFREEMKWIVSMRISSNPFPCKRLAVFKIYL